MLPHDYQPEHYESLLTRKVARYLPSFEALGAPPPSLYRSPTSAFRMRAEFRVWHEGDDLNFVMFDREKPKEPVIIETFPFASLSIQKLLPVLRDALKNNAELRHKLFQIEFLSTLSGDVLVTLIYHRKLGDEWTEAAKALSSKLALRVVGRSRGQKVVLDRDWLTETLTVQGKTFHYKQPEQAFIQPNARVNESMLTWACDQAPPSTRDLLELYCGIGNFTIPLSEKFRFVLATEVSKVATRAASENLSLNAINNVEFARLAAEEVTEALSGTREFRRLKALSTPIAAYDLETVLVDPPRAGLDSATLSLVGEFDQMLYISCNPLTLLDNLSQLTESHDIISLAFFDQFPYTDHLECGVNLRRRGHNEAIE